MDNILAYIVNYKDNQGFAVINSDRSSMPILVRAESGTLDTNKLNEMILRLMDVCQTKSDISMSPMEDDDDMIDTYPDTSSGKRAYTLNIEYIGY